MPSQAPSNEVLVRTLDGLPDLSSVNGDVRIYNNEELQSFDGLEDLTTIGGNVTYTTTRSSPLSKASLSRPSAAAWISTTTRNYRT